ncbi:MAG TPA: protein-methionine-sulfoxide reductase heme-binding subunit MsrQ [Thermoflexales bacterium]|nr:protein-methionine-sulfoxide reductase heme-binding subunit MsrQ [Thermoflexales bacterium]HQY24296.1 protein-methionine-sulfoxide reductase heme-binding subunit MsrQ [Thermoflexales bacterium]HQZ52737.1 protein-methionine-sulfoxide reductase heme-binding subunit MsrQ [Thermoflexales bacterium]HRA52298.1 protein-methionine-sulfoxide reductase heme-binding subunit MsrQ [Thermoflexales bacterium]
MPSLESNKTPSWPKQILAWIEAHPHLVTALFALAPLGFMLRDLAYDWLTANPIQELTFRTGKVGLVLLVGSLACSPLNAISGLRFALKIRRDLGLFGFLYISLHLLIFTALDLGLDVALIVSATSQKLFVLAGMASFALLIPLAITSTKGWQRRLGKRWKPLHKLVYLALPIAALHYVWLVKADIRTPLAYAAIIGLLLLARVPAVRGWMSSLRRRVETGLRGPAAGKQKQNPFPRYPPAKPGDISEKSIL